MHEKSFMDFSAQRIEKSINSLVSKWVSVLGDNDNLFYDALYSHRAVHLCANQNFIFSFGL